MKTKFLIMAFVIMSSLINVINATDYPLTAITYTWVSESDNNWKIIFSSDKTCKQYYENELIETDTYFLSNSSPQCGKTVLIDDYTCYLQLTNTETKESTCYEIYGLTSTILTLRMVDNGDILIFNR